MNDIFLTIIFHVAVPKNSLNFVILLVTRSFFFLLSKSCLLIFQPKFLRTLVPEMIFIRIISLFQIISKTDHVTSNVPNDFTLNFTPVLIKNYIRATNYLSRSVRSSR